MRVTEMISEKTGWSTGLVVTLAVLGAGVVGSFTVGQYRLGEAEKRVGKLETRQDARDSADVQDALRLERIEAKLGQLVETTGEMKRDIKELREGSVRPAGGRGR